MAWDLLSQNIYYEKPHLIPFTGAVSGEGMIYWLHRIGQLINGLNMRNDEEVIQGLLMLLGALGSAILLIVVLSRRKSEKALS